MECAKGGTARQRSAERENGRENEKDDTKACAGDKRWKKKSMDTSCSIGEVFPWLSHAQVCNLLLWQKATRSLRHCPAVVRSRTAYRVSRSDRGRPRVVMEF